MNTFFALFTLATAGRLFVRHGARGLDLYAGGMPTWSQLLRFIGHAVRAWLWMLLIFVASFHIVSSSLR